MFCTRHQQALALPSLANDCEIIGASPDELRARSGSERPAVSQKKGGFKQTGFAGSVWANYPGPSWVEFKRRPFDAAKVSDLNRSEHARN